MENDKAKRDRILNVVLCALVKDGKILLIKRVKDPYKGHWGLVGGKMEFGEFVEETAVREFYEETGIRASFDCLAGIASEIVFDKGEKANHFLLFVSRLRSESSEFSVGHEGELKWFDLSALDRGIMIPSDYIMVREYILKDNPVKIHKIRMNQDKERYSVEEFS
jgi:8-oxo-dGTP pyrophosphatase MutT (NUDIX family)